MKRILCTLIVAGFLILAGWGYMRLTCSGIYERNFTADITAINGASQNESARCEYAELKVNMFLREHFAW